MLLIEADDGGGINFPDVFAFGQKLAGGLWYTGQVLYISEDIMDTEITPTQLAIEYLRRDKSNLSPAQYLKKLKQLELEFTDLLALSSNELKEEIYFAWRLGVHVH